MQQIAQSTRCDLGVCNLAVDKISEFTVPVTITYQLGRLGNIALSSGYASVDLTSSDPTSLPNQKLSGVLDTEARLTLNLLPGRLVGLVTAALPTGLKTVGEYARVTHGTTTTLAGIVRIVFVIP